MWDEWDLLPLLTVVSEPLRGASYRLTPGLRTIGRGVGVDILIDDRKVSRRHAALELDDGRVLLADAGSRNGTWLNDRRVSGVVELHDGDLIRFGHVELRFCDPAAAPAELVDKPVPPPEPARIGLVTHALPAVTLTIAVPAPDANPAGPTPGPHFGPTPNPQFGLTLTVVGSCVALIAWAVWVYLLLHQP
jgi:predicted component of type VI protein secretion system